MSHEMKGMIVCEVSDDVRGDVTDEVSDDVSEDVRDDVNDEVSDDVSDDVRDDVRGDGLGSFWEGHVEEGRGKVVCVHLHARAPHVLVLPLWGVWRLWCGVA